MSDWDDEFADMLKSAKRTKSILTKTLANVEFAIDNADEEVTNDTYYALVGMMQQIYKNNIDINALCEDAIRDIDLAD